MLRNRLLLVALWLVFYCSFTLVMPPLLDDADSVHSEVAREMLVRHDWTTLYANGIRYLEKAPLLYWSMAASFRVFGVHTWSARLPLAFAVLALALVMESFARRAFGSVRAGLYAGMILLSSFGIFIFSRITIPDVMVCLWLTLALYFYWLTEQQERPNRLYCWGFAICCALNVLTKGLIGIVFPVMIVLAHLLVTRRSLRGCVARIRQLWPGTSVVVFLVVAVPWHVLIALANPSQGHPGEVIFSHGHWMVPGPSQGNVHGWLWFYFVNEQVLRYLNLRVPRDYDTVPLLLFWGLLLVWMMPWSGFLFRAVGMVPWKALWSRWWSASLRAGESTKLLLGLWAAIPMLFFSFSTRQEYYVLPTLPALMLLITAWLDAEAKDVGSSALRSPRMRAGKRISAVLFVLGSVAALVAGFFVVHARVPGPNTDLAGLLRQNPGDYALSFGHFLDLNAQAMGAFRTPLVITAVVLFGGTLANWLCRRRNRPHEGNLWLTGMAFGFLLAAHLGLQIFSPVLTSQQLAAAMASALKPDDLIVIHGEYESASTLGFYLRRNDIHIFEGRSSNLWYGSFFPDAPAIFEDKASMERVWMGTGRVFLWQDLSEPLPELHGKAYLIARSGGKEILSNRPD